MGFFQKIIDALQTRSVQVVDPSIFDHPIAMQVSREPASRGGSVKNMAPRLVQQGNMVYYKRSSALMWMLVMFIVLPILFVGFSFFEDGLLESGDMLSVGLSALFSLIVCLVVYRVIFFDGNYCINGQSQIIYPLKSTKNLTKYNEKKMIRFDVVVALQIISKKVHTKNSSYLSYELNLVLSDFSRRTLVDHSDYHAISSDGKVISKIIGVPVWDGVAGAATIATDLPKQTPIPTGIRRDVVKDVPVEDVSSGDDDLFS